MLRLVANSMAHQDTLIFTAQPRQLTMIWRTMCFLMAYIHAITLIRQFHMVSSKVPTYSKI